MFSISATSSALQGMNMNQTKMTGHADRISQMGNDSRAASSEEEASWAEETTGMITAVTGYTANLQVYRRSDSETGTQVDERA